MRSKVAGPANGQGRTVNSVTPGALNESGCTGLKVPGSTMLATENTSSPSSIV
jgi:hypothetical protein